MTISKKLAACGGLLMTLILAGGLACAPRYAGEGDAVSVHYTGTLDDGTEFDSSEGGDPIEFVLGEPGLIEGFEQAIYGMAVGETKTVTIPSDQAYGPRNENHVVEMDLDEFPGGSFVVGQTLPVSFGSRSAVITKVTDTTVTLDANFFLLGEDLTFEIRLVGIE